MNLRFCWFLVGCVGLLALFAGCDTTPGIRQEKTPPAFASGSFALSPRVVKVQTTGTRPNLRGDTLLIPVDSIPANVGFSIPFQASVRAKHPERLDSVKYVVRSPLRGFTLSQVQGIRGASGLLQPTDNGFFIVDTTVTLPAALPGLYTINVFGVSRKGALSQQQLSGSLQLISAGAGPTIKRLATPDTVQVPKKETKRIRIRATVTDAQGPLNVGKVEVTGPDGGKYRLHDDGSRFSGDGAAGDSTYTTRYPVETTQRSGTFTFRARATDRTGQQSAPASVAVTFVK